MKCQYCGTENKLKSNCEFCEMELDVARPVRKMIVTLQDAYKSVPEILLMHTYDLLHLLKLVRVERSAVYNYSKVSEKAAKETTVGETLAKNFWNEYEVITKRKNIIENIIKDRLGYIPKYIDDKFLDKYEQKLVTTTKKQTATTV